jgi:hypothetical protein
MPCHEQNKTEENSVSTVEGAHRPINRLFM